MKFYIHGRHSESVVVAQRIKPLVRKISADAGGH